MPPKQQHHESEKVRKLGRTFNPVIILLVICLMSIENGCAYQHQRLVNQVDVTTIDKEVQLSPKVVDFGAVLPGTYDGCLHLKNLSDKPLTDLSVLTTCFCVTPGVKHVVQVQANKEMTIPFKIRLPVPSYAHQMIQVYTNTGVFIAGTEIKAVVNPPLQSVLNLTMNVPTLRRSKFEDDSDTVTIRTKINHLTKNPRFLVDAPWLHTHQKKIGDFLILSFWANKLASEGKFVVPAHIEYATANGSERMDIAINGQVTSKISTSPSSLSFGIVTNPFKTSPIQCSLLYHALHTPLSISCSSNHIQARVLSQHGARYVVEARLRPNATGEIRDMLYVKDQARTIVTIPISAFVLPGKALH